MIIIKYGEKTIGEIVAGQTAILNCFFKKSKGNIVVEFQDDGVISYMGNKKYVYSGQVANLACNQKWFTDNITIYFSE